MKLLLIYAMAVEGLEIYRFCLLYLSYDNALWLLPNVGYTYHQ